jgi:hypothetical protein
VISIIESEYSSKLNFEWIEGKALIGSYQINIIEREEKLSLLSF